MKLTEKAYIAGLLDGEGTITMCKSSYHYRTRKHNDSYFVVAGIYNTNKKVLKWVKNKTKLGSLLHHKHIWYWQVSNRTVCKFLPLVLPYLRIKQKQAKIALQFQKERIQNKSTKLNKSQLALRERYRKKITKLNHKKKDIKVVGGEV